MMEAEGLLPRRVETFVVSQGLLQKSVGSDDVGLNEVSRAVNGSIDMGLGSEMHDEIGLMLCQQTADGLTVSDIGLFELMARMLTTLRERLQIAGVGELVDSDDFVFGISDEIANNGRTDETCAARDEKFESHSMGAFTNGNGLFAERGKDLNASKAVGGSRERGLAGRTTGEEMLQL